MPFRILGVNANSIVDAGESDFNAVSRFVRQFRIEFPILLAGDAVYRQYNRPNMPVSPFPLDYVIDREGRVAYHGSDYDPDAMMTVIDSLLGFEPEEPENPEEPEEEDPPAPLEGLRFAPNPFGGISTLRFDLPTSGPVSVEIYSVEGRLKRKLAGSLLLDAGRRELYWDGRDDAGRSLPTGVYLFRARLAGREESGKVLILR